MSEENVEIVRRAFAFKVRGHGDPAEALAHFDPDVVLNSFEEPTSYGRNAVRDTSSAGRAPGRKIEATAEEFIDAGDRVVVTAYFRGRGRGSGIEVDARFHEVYSLREGKIVRVDEFTERARALQAAGLSE